MVATGTSTEMVAAAQISTAMQDLTHGIIEAKQGRPETLVDAMQQFVVDVQKTSHVIAQDVKNFTAHPVDSIVESVQTFRNLSTGQQLNRVMEGATAIRSDDGRKQLIKMVLQEICLDDETIVYEAHKPFDLILTTTDRTLWRS